MFFETLEFHSTPTGLEDVSRYPQLLATLLEDPTWTEEDIKKLAGLNLLRVFSEVEQVNLVIFSCVLARPSVCLSASLFVRLSACMSVCLSVFLPACLSVCLSVGLPV